MLILLYIFLFIVVIKLSLNTYNYLRITRLANYHVLWLSDKKDNFHTYRSEILSLFKKAGVKDSMVPVSQRVGYGQIANFSASIFDNFPSNKQLVVATTLVKFDEAQGVFRKNMFNSINPLYWLETVVFLPKELLRYLEFAEEKTAFKILNIILSFLWWLTLALFGFFKPQLQELAIKLIGEF